ncbi:MAG: hypothetical protein NZ902_06505 [Acidilobaceae archaeon]|nr:hypothetical protein [Acidilobaceae archaeon]MDW7974883.1 hypothetical protein [Sulfolobales archaeon]
MPATTHHGLEYPLSSDNPALLASKPAVNQVGWLEKAFRQLDPALHIRVTGTPEETWVSRNAILSGSVWNREDTSSGASALRFLPDNSLAYQYAGPGANPISWNSRTIIGPQGHLLGSALQDGSVVASKLADGSVTRRKVSFPNSLSTGISSDYSVTTFWTQIMGVSTPEAGRLLILVQLAIRYVGGGSVQTFNGSLYIGGTAVDPVVSLRTGEVNYTTSQSLVHVAETAGGTSVTFAVAASANNTFQVVSAATRMFVAYLPGT